MGIFHRLPIFGVVASTLAFASAKTNFSTETRKEKLNPEDAGFWDRILEGVATSVAPAAPSKSPVAFTPAPFPVTEGPRPTEAPAPAPSATPTALVMPPSPPPSSGAQATPAPTTGVCSLDVTVSCLDGDGTLCGQIVRPQGQCVVSVTYTYLIENIGSTQLDTISLNRTRGGTTENLLDDIANPLFPGGSVNITEIESLDLCIDGIYETTVVGKAARSNAPVCEVTRKSMFEIVGAITPVPTPAPTSLALSSSSPSASPSEQPVNGTIAPTSDCDLVIEIGCLPPFFGADCNEIDTQNTECQDLPSSLVMRYTGDDCNSSFNIQPNTLFSCVDFQLSDGNASYILVTGHGGDEEVYFSGLVQIGDEFTIESESLIANDTNVLIFDPAGLTDPAEIIASGVLLQDITFHTSCENFLFLKDRFGGVQLTEFENERQGRVSSFQNLTLTFTVELPEDDSVGSTALSDLTITSNIEVSNGEIRDLTALVVGNQVTVGSSLVVQETFLIDLTQRKRYTTTATIVGQSDVGKICQGSDRYQFTAGSPLPPIFPTVTPTASPTVTPFPTPDPETAACEVEASISCSVADGRRCDLRNPVGRTCTGTAPFMLQFMYHADATCDGNQTAANFRCTDLNTDIARPTSVYVLMSDGDQETLFSGIMAEGQIADIPIGRSDSMSIQVFTVDEDDLPDVILQEIEMETLCNEESALTLLTFFGSMQLVGYQNAELGIEQVFANLEIEYKAENAGVLSMELLGALASSPFTGFQDFLSGEKLQVLARGASTTFTERFTLNLEATAGSDFTFTFLAQGQGTRSGEPCDSTDDFTLSIQS